MREFLLGFLSRKANSQHFLEVFSVCFALE